MEKLLVVKIQHEKSFVRINVADYRSNSSPRVSQFYLHGKHTPDEVCEAAYKFINGLIVEG